MEVQRRAGQDDAGQATEEERGQEAERPQHRGVEGDGPAPHRADPVEELHPGRYGDQERHAGEERQVDRAGDEHVVRPHGDREDRDAERRADQADVAEDRLAAEHRQDLGDDAEERQRDDVDLGVAEEPEQVLPQDRPAVRGVEDVGAEQPVGLEREQRAGQDRERDQHQQAGDQRVPDEDRHPEHRHAGRAHADDRGDEVDRTEDRAETGHPQAHDPQVAADAGRADARWTAGCRRTSRSRRRPPGSGSRRRRSGRRTGTASS